MNKSALTRRAFMGLTFGTVVGTTALAQNMSSANMINGNTMQDRTPPLILDGELIITSSAGLAGHCHQIAIPLEIFTTPTTEILEFVSTKTVFHRHSIHLSPEQISAVASGSTIAVPDSQWGEHTFEIFIPENSES